MHVRSLSIKTTEILQLDLALREEMSQLVDEVDALLFAWDTDTRDSLPTSTPLLKALETRIQALSRISSLLSERALFAPHIDALKEGLASYKKAPYSYRMPPFLSHVGTLQELIKIPPSYPPVESPVSKDKSPPPTERPSDSELHREPPTLRTISPPAPQTAQAARERARLALEEEFQTTTAAVNDLLEDLPPYQLTTDTTRIRIADFLKHANRIVQDLSETVAGHTPTPRPKLERMPCLLLTIQGHSFALPQKAVKKVLSPGDHAALLETWELPGGTLTKVAGQITDDVCIASLLGLRQRVSDPALPKVLVDTSNGPFLMTVETSGDFVPLVPDLKAQYLSELGPYLGAAIPPPASFQKQDSVIIILNPERLVQAAAKPQAFRPLRPGCAAPPSPTSMESKSTKSLVGITRQYHHVAIPIAQISHIELIPAADVQWHHERATVPIGTKSIPAFDADQIISTNSASKPQQIEDFQAVVVNHPHGPSAILLREVIGPKEEANLTDFGFAQRPGVRGTALCDDLIVCALDPAALFASFSHLSKI